MKHYIGYFDFLGYKQFLLNNSEEHLKTRASHILRDIELALSQGKTRRSALGGGIADLTDVTVNCLNISDTVIFWSFDDTIESCLELLYVCSQFNHTQMLYNFPIRGCVIFDSFEIIHAQQYNPKGAIYSPNLMYGKGLYHAHEKAGNLSWSGTVIDESLIKQAGHDERIQSFLAEHTIEYDVPYKEETIREYALRLSYGALNETAFQNLVRNVKEVFRKDKKEVNELVEIKIENTIRFIEAHREK